MPAGAFTFNQWLALVLALGGLLSILVAAFLVARTRTLAARAAERARQAAVVVAEAADQLRRAAAGAPEAVEDAKEKVAKADATLSDVKDLLETLPKEERFPGLMLFAGIALVFLALVSAGILQLAPAAGA